VKLFSGSGTETRTKRRCVFDERDDDREGPIDDEEGKNGGGGVDWLRLSFEYGVGEVLKRERSFETTETDETSDERGE